jgi:PAS domain S-box-containing protein
MVHPVLLAHDGKMLETNAPALSLQEVNELLERKVSELTRDLEAALGLLQESERSFGLLVRSITDYAMYMLDRNGYVVSWNAGAERIKGYDANEIIGAHFSCFYTEEDRKANLPLAALQAAARDRRLDRRTVHRRCGPRFQ